MTVDRPDREAWVAMRSLVLDLHSGHAEAVQALGMSFGRIKALRRIAADGPMGLRELVVVLGGDAPHTTVLVDDLVGRGLVERTVHPDDRRARVVAVTAAGRAAARRANARLERPPSGFGALSDEEVRTLAGLLRRLVDDQGGGAGD